MISIQVTVGDQVLHAHLDDTAVARDFVSLLPLQLKLRDFHATEKVADLPRRLDTSQAPAHYAPARGDITYYAPWGNLAIFYKPFQSSQGLVRLGAFDGPIDALLTDAGQPLRIELAPSTAVTESSHVQ
ncbi:MAG: hypothetical protein KDI37_07360 [Xanthomonadales bacterium]|nr:hypothetical protein [Xanthomonadales bacterium]MCB1641534.1 hypothetical protein [Xanthomonadales bacterium]